MTNVIIQIVYEPESRNLQMSGNTTDINLINMMLDKLKLQLLLAKPKEPSLIHTL